MKLALICFDDVVIVPGGKRIGEDTYTDACEQTFRMHDGWEIAEITQGVFTLRAEHMPNAMTVGGYGYRYFAAPPEPAPVVEQPKGKRR